MAQVERRMLEVEGYETHCQRIYSTINPDLWGCASSSSLLPILHINSDKHEEQCNDGFCYAPSSMLPLCTSGAIEWGVPPCTSKIYDWRDGILAAEDEWNDLIQERLCGPNPIMRRMLLPAEATCTADEIVPSTVRYVRSFYSLGWPLLNYTGEEDSGGGHGPAGNASDWDSQWVELRSSTYIGALKKELRSAQDDLSATSAFAKTYSKEAKEGRPLSVLWSNSASGALNDFMIPDLMLAMASFAFVFLYVPSMGCQPTHGTPCTGTHR